MLAAHETESGGRDQLPAADKVDGDENRRSTGCQRAESRRTTSQRPRRANSEQRI